MVNAQPWYLHDNINHLIINFKFKTIMNLPFYAYLPVVAGIIGGLIGGYYYKQYKKNHPNKKEITSDNSTSYQADKNIGS